MGTDPALRVCHIASGDLWAGAEAVLYDLLVELDRRKSLSVSATLLNDYILSERLRQAGVKVAVIPESDHGSIALFFKLRKALKASAPDIVHTHRYKENILGGIAAKLVGVRHLICTIHGMPEPVSGFRSFKAKLKFAVEAFVFRHLASGIVAVSADIARQIRPRAGSTPVAVIHNGIRITAMAAKDASEERRSDKAGPAKVKICTVGRLNPIKGYGYLIKAVALLAQRGLNFELLIIGDGPLREQLLTLSKEFGVENCVRFLGFNPNPLEIINDCEVFVLSSLHEGISIALLEALSLGKAVVVTDVGGNPEVISNEETGLLVASRDQESLADALARLIEDRDLRTRLGESGKQVVAASFTDRAMADAIEEMYYKLDEMKFSG